MDIFGPYVVTFVGIRAGKLEEEPIQFIIKSRRLADGYRKMFQFIWDNTKGKMKTRTLSKSDIKGINAELNELYGIKPLDKKDNVQLIESTQSDTKHQINYLKVNGEPAYFYKDNKIIPTLKTLLKNNFLKKITVDMGAVKFLCGGADPMRPGIAEIDDGIKKGDIISIIDVNNKKSIVVAQSLFSTEDMKTQTSGKSALNIHYISDSIWNLQ